MKKQANCLCSVPQKYISDLSILANPVSPPNAHSKVRSNADLALFTAFPVESFRCCLQNAQALVDVTQAFEHSLQATRKDRVNGKSITLASSNHKEWEGQ